MEHKIVLGGEAFLPFARSRVKALKALGLPYADQSFEVDGVSIRVRIQPGHEYIRIEGGGNPILSCIIKDGTVVTLPTPPDSPIGTEPKKVLRSVKPTENAWVHTLKRASSEPPSLFSDDRFLLGKGEESQWGVLSPSMFSGVMAKVVAILMGRGIKVNYDYKWDKCHGVTFDSKGKPWLVEVSSTNGVIAMKLPLSRGNAKSKCDAEKEIVSLVGGIPTGETFPVGQELEDAIEAGSVLQLLTIGTTVGVEVDETPRTPAMFYAENAYASTMGWSFSDTGSEAHNTCYKKEAYDIDEDSVLVEGFKDKVFGSHYKLAIDIAIDDLTWEATGSAVITRVSKNRIKMFGPYWNGVVFYDGSNKIPLPYQGYIEPTFAGYDSVDVTIIAIHSGGTLQLIKLKWDTSVYASSHTSTWIDLGDGYTGEMPSTFYDLDTGRVSAYSFGCDKLKADMGIAYRDHKRGTRVTGGYVPVLSFSASWAGYRTVATYTLGPGINSLFHSAHTRDSISVFNVNETLIQRGYGAATGGGWYLVTPEPPFASIVTLIDGSIVFNAGGDGVTITEPIPTPWPFEVLHRWIGTVKTLWPSGAISTVSDTNMTGTEDPAELWYANAEVISGVDVYTSQNNAEGDTRVSCSVLGVALNEVPQHAINYFIDTRTYGAMLANEPMVIPKQLPHQNHKYDFIGYIK